MKRLFLLLLVSVLGAESAAAAEAKRPNILFAFADDWGRYASAYAKLDGPGTLSDAVQTPNFDRVAREGVLFRKAFVSAPSCTPCRSAILSGQHFWRTGRASILRGAIWDYSNPSYALLLGEAGYHLGETYKVWGPGTPSDAPYGAGKYAYEKAGSRFNKFSTHVTAMVAQGQPLGAAKNAIYDEVRGNFNAFLAARKPGQPFCYWFGPTTTHRKWMKGSGKKLWGIEPDSLQGKMPAYLPDVPELREDFADYLGEAQAVDAALGVLLARLAEIGELDNTLIVVSGGPRRARLRPRQVQPLRLRRQCLPGDPRPRCDGRSRGRRSHHLAGPCPDVSRNGRTETARRHDRPLPRQSPALDPIRPGGARARRRLYRPRAPRRNRPCRLHAVSAARDPHPRFSLYYQFPPRPLAAG
jgi:hypothetical protein